MRVMTYNVLRGGEGRFEHIQEVISSRSPDILVINEACEWGSSGRLECIRNLLHVPGGQCVLSHSNARSLSGRRYDLAFFSVFPLEGKTIYTDPKTVWHSLIHAIAHAPSPFHVLAAHLSPRSEDWRLREVPLIKDILMKHRHEPMILLGDLNSLSPRDPYPQTLQAQLNTNNIAKYGNPPRFDVITELEHAGWHDTLHQTIKATRDSTKLHITVTEEAEDKDHLDLRLDYIMVNEMAFPRVKGVTIEDTPQTRRASDHFPVVAEIEDFAGARSSGTR